MTVDTNSTFTFTSSSTIDTYGILYNYPADPSYPNQNLIMSDDDSDGGRQFRIIAALTSGSTYVLIVTTYAPAVVGSFSVRAYGASTVALVAFTPSTIRPIITPRSESWKRLIAYFSNGNSVCPSHSSFSF